jgi:hypothetical protein
MIGELSLIALLDDCILKLHYTFDIDQTAASECIPFTRDTHVHDLNRR